MSIKIQLVILIATLYCFFTVCKHVKKGKMRIEYALIWVLTTFALVVIALIPQILFVLSKLFEVASPVNLVFLSIIFVLGVVVYILSLKLSALEEKTTHLVQQVALLKKQQENDE